MNILAIVSGHRATVGAVLSSQLVAAHPEFTVSAVTCPGSHAGWSDVEAPGGPLLVLVRSGRFHRATRVGAVELDRTQAYLSAPGEDQRFAHPAGGDECTSVAVRPALWRQLAGESPRLVRPTVYVDARLELAHRRLLAGGDVDYRVAELLLDLLAGAVAQVVAGPAPGSAGGSSGSGTRAGAPADRRLVDAARAAINDNHRASVGLFPLAALLGASPYRLSRAFRRHQGVSLTRYRNRVRVGQAMERIAAGEPLAGVAADLGFSDQAHLTRTVREHVGHTPAAIRRLLGSWPV